VEIYFTSLNQPDSSGLVSLLVLPIGGGDLFSSPSVGIYHRRGDVGIGGDHRVGK
jgi:hypothetical protein